jgi:hypothetical protein
LNCSVTKLMHSFPKQNAFEHLGLAMQLVSSISLALTMLTYVATRRPLRAYTATRQCPSMTV